VSGELSSDPNITLAEFRADEAAPGIHVRFGGFTLDQSFIPGWSNAIRRLFREGQVDESVCF
jgi:hypothetical protein